MNSITPTEGFLTTDGNFFLYKEEALAHQHALDLDKEIDEFVASEAPLIQPWQAKIDIQRWEEHKKLKELQAK